MWRHIPNYGGGPVPAGTTYQDWLKEQPRERQLEILGLGRLAAFERGVTLREMIDPGGRPKRLEDLPPVGKAFHVDPERFREWFDSPEGDFVMGNLPPHIRGLLGTESDSLTFSLETLAKQKARHPEIRADEYVKAINKIENRNVPIHRTRDRHIGLVVEDGRHWAVIIKTTGDRSGSYLVSLHRLDEHSLSQFLRHPRT